MPNLNITDSFWLDIAGVIEKMGSQDAAVGNAMRWIRYAQEKHKHGELVSEQDFRDSGFSEALFPKFAKRTPGGIECVGAKKHFSWLLTKSEAGAAGGRASAEARRSKTGSAVPQNATNDPTNQTEATPKQTEAPEAIPIPICIPISSSNPIRECTRARSVNPVFNDWQAFREAIPLHAQTAYAKWYPDPPWLEEQYEKCFHKAMLEPISAPKSRGGWLQYLSCWLELAWKSRRVPRSARSTIDTLELA